MNSKSVQDKLSSIGNWFTALPEKFMKMPIGKQVYTVLWALTGIFLVVTIAVAIEFGSGTSKSGIDSIAAISLTFVILLIVSTVTTAIVSKRVPKIKSGGKK